MDGMVGVLVVCGGGAQQCGLERTGRGDGGGGGCEWGQGPSTVDLSVESSIGPCLPD